MGRAHRPRAGHRPPPRSRCDSHPVEKALAAGTVCDSSLARPTPTRRISELTGRTARSIGPLPAWRALSPGRRRGRAGLAVPGGPRGALAPPVNLYLRRRARFARAPHRCRRRRCLGVPGVAVGTARAFGAGAGVFDARGGALFRGAALTGFFCSTRWAAIVLGATRARATTAAQAAAPMKASVRIATLSDIGALSEASALLDLVLSRSGTGRTFRPPGVGVTDGLDVGITDGLQAGVTDAALVGVTDGFFVLAGAL
jgi:hypothetical protein